MNNKTNLYIHVPFCLSKCKYCAFFSSACQNPDWETYTKKLINEINYWAKKLSKTSINTIFFGGGTPSLLPTTYLEQILDNITSSFDLNSDTEITLEANPGTLSKEKLIEFKNLGINRLSIGVQSLDDERLAFLGRIHNSKQALDLIEQSQKIGLRTSADFIYGLPYETAKDIKALCKDINSIGLSHCSLYELTIEPNSVFGKSNLKMPSNEEMANMYETISENLNLPRYEVSNYAVPGEECRHNQNIWDGESYIGLGEGAAGRPYINNTWYEQMGNFELFSPLSNQTRAIEKVITGFRQIRGIKLTEDVKATLNFNFIDNNLNYFKYNETKDRIAMTKSGMLILDELLTKVIK